ncbi:MAG: DUF4097 family beta strand repeat-containing protein [candidate division Zixibacteria bacterium]|nr:DUF4097 family beta strand repeat-containing protein [candidate division Zixibacteria bacterium]
MTLIILPILFSGASLNAKEFVFAYQKAVEVKETSSLKLTYIGGDAHFSVNESGMITIDAIKRVDATNNEEAEEVAAHIEIKVEEENGSVTVTTNYLRLLNKSDNFWQKMIGSGHFDSFGDVDWNISVPEGCNVEITNTSGHITAAGLSGGFQIRSSASTIELNSIEGKIEIENGSGSTSGEFLIGPMTIKQALGAIMLKHVEGDIRLKTESADVDIVQDRGALDITTVTGRVNLQTSLESSRDCFVETASGNISLIIPEWSSGVLAITSKTGDISTDMPIAIRSMSKQEIVGTFGEGGIKIALRSGSGDVSVAQF